MPVALVAISVASRSELGTTYLSRKPLLPGSSTLDQLDKILAVAGLPDEFAVKAIDSKFAQTMIEQRRKADSGTLVPASNSHRVAKLTEMLPAACPAGVIDVVAQMLDINPNTRMTVQQALQHQWMRPFVKENEEQLDVCAMEMNVSLDDDHKFTTANYRDELYNELRRLRKESGGTRFNRFFSGSKRS